MLKKNLNQNIHNVVLPYLHIGHEPERKIEINIPKAPAIKFFMGLPSPIEANIVRPKIARAKYSG